MRVTNSSVNKTCSENFTEYVTIQTGISPGPENTQFVYANDKQQNETN